jgi:hypothetical protein
VIKIAIVERDRASTEVEANLTAIERKKLSTSVVVGQPVEYPTREAY